MFVKICGITSEADALTAVAMGADAVGFVFAPSPREISLEKAKDIAKRLPAETITVGVFQNQHREEVADIVVSAGLKAAQLHGDESPEDTRWIRTRVPFVIKGFVAGSGRMDSARIYRADAVLIDSSNPGSGNLFNWADAENAPEDVRLIIAGGLTPDNVQAAIQKTSPWGVDVSTGVEKSPGEKDINLLRRFIKSAKTARAKTKVLKTDSPYNWQGE